MVLLNVNSSWSSFHNQNRDNISSLRQTCNWWNYYCQNETGIDGVMVSILAVDRKFELRSGETKDYEIVYIFVTSPPNFVSNLYYQYICIIQSGLITTNVVNTVLQRTLDHHPWCTVTEIMNLLFTTVTTLYLIPVFTCLCCIIMFIHLHWWSSIL